jgi:hypothetical protein
VELNSWPGLIAVILAVVSFYATTYLVVALNTGWRFGYWITGSCFGVLMALLSIFWIVNPVGPQGAQPRWIPIAAGAEISQVSFKGTALNTPAQYPTGSWQPAPAGAEQTDAFSSSVTACLSTAPESLPDDEREACEAAQALMPDEEDIPVIDGSAVAVTPDVQNVRFADENGTLAQATVSPVTRDPRVSRDPQGEALARPFRVVAWYDEGSLRFPAYASLAIFVLFSAFHLWGLNRAEKRKLNPAVV